MLSSVFLLPLDLFMAYVLMFSCVCSFVLLEKMCRAFIHTESGFPRIKEKL